MYEPLTRLLDNFPLEFFLNLPEEILAAFAQAHLLTKDRYEASEQIAMLGQNRHAMCEAAFRKVARNSNIESTALDTNPRGGSYSLASKNGIYLIRSNIQVHLGTPKLTKFRREFALLNAWLEPQQYDFFQPLVEPPKDKLCGIIVITSHKYHNSDPSLPAFIGLGIPNSDLSDWLILKSIGEILALYHDRDTKNREVQEQPSTIKDNAIPRLKSKFET